MKNFVILVLSTLFALSSFADDHHATQHDQNHEVDSSSIPSGNPGEPEEENTGPTRPLSN